MSTIFLSIDDLGLLYDVSPTTAQRRNSKIKSRFGIRKYDKISVVDYANFHKLNVEFVLEMLEKKRQALKRK